MTTHVLQFAELSDSDRKEIGRLGKLAKGDRIEVRVKRRGGADQTLSLPPDAAALIEALLGHLLEGDRVAVLTEDQELSPNDAASILGVSRPLVVHRMNIGDRKSTRLNSSHANISYAVFCLKKKNKI